jgi:hypothetical protein
MKKRLLLFVIGLFAMTVMLIPKNSEASMFRGAPEFGTNEVRQIFDDFMLKTKFNLKPQYTIDETSKKGNLTTYIIDHGIARQFSSSLYITVNNSGIITKIYFKTFCPSGYNVESFYKYWGGLVIERYGEPTDAGTTDFGNMYGNYYEDGKYKYSIVSQVVNPQTFVPVPTKGLGIFEVKIEALQ